VKVGPVSDKRVIRPSGAPLLRKWQDFFRVCRHPPAIGKPQMELPTSHKGTSGESGVALLRVGRLLSKWVMRNIWVTRVTAGVAVGSSIDGIYFQQRRQPSQCSLDNDARKATVKTALTVMAASYLLDVTSGRSGLAFLANSAHTILR